MPEHFRYVVVEGPIGVGKTSLANRLAAEFESEPYVKRTSSLTWAIKHLHRAAAGGREGSYAVPDDKIRQGCEILRSLAS